jgi:hypothetical protein
MASEKAAGIGDEMELSTVIHKLFHRFRNGLKKHSDLGRYLWIIFSSQGVYLQRKSILYDLFIKSMRMVFDIYYLKLGVQQRNAIASQKKQSPKYLLVQTTGSRVRRQLPYQLKIDVRGMDVFPQERD